MVRQPRREAAEETAPAGPVPADSQPPGLRKHPFLCSKAPSLGSLVVAPLPKGDLRKRGLGELGTEGQDLRGRHV